MTNTFSWAGIAADMVVVLHFLFAVFVLFGGVLLLWWKKLVWVHLPAAIWGMVIEFAGWICPLTPLENKLRVMAGLEMYEGDFVMRYIMPVLYPEDLTRAIQVSIGLVILVINSACYYYVFKRRNN